jgi:hypothetical protein
MPSPILIAQGRATRRAIAAAILPRLRIGGDVPSCAAVGRALGISHVAAHKHVRRMLAEQRITVELVGRSRLVVVGRDTALGELRMAAG